MDFRKEANRLADALGHGETYDCGNMVVYGWRVLSSAPDTTSEAAELLIKMADEIERLKADVNHWREARRVAIDCGELMREELKKLRDELRIAREENERLRAEVAGRRPDSLLGEGDVEEGCSYGGSI